MIWNICCRKLQKCYPPPKKTKKQKTKQTTLSWQFERVLCERLTGMWQAGWDAEWSNCCDPGEEVILRLGGVGGWGVSNGLLAFLRSIPKKAESAHFFLPVNVLAWNEPKFRWAEMLMHQPGTGAKGNTSDDKTKNRREAVWLNRTIHRSSSTALIWLSACMCSR